MGRESQEGPWSLGEDSRRSQEAEARGLELGWELDGNRGRRSCGRFLPACALSAAGLAPPALAGLVGVPVVQSGPGLQRPPASSAQGDGNRGHHMLPEVRWWEAMAGRMGS